MFNDDLFGKKNNRSVLKCKFDTNMINWTHFNAVLIQKRERERIPGTVTVRKQPYHKSLNAVKGYYKLLFFDKIEHYLV